MEKMGIPPKFVKNYISELETGSSISILLSPLCKFCLITVEKDQSSGTLFFSGGWSRFLASHGIMEYDVLLLRYEGNMVFTVKVFGPDGCQKGCKDQGTSNKQQEQSDETTFSDTKMEEEDAPSSSRKRKRMEKKPGGEDNSKRPRSPTTSLNKAPLSMNRPVYEIGPPSWMKREISAYILSNHLTIAWTFCKAIGLCSTSEVTLRTTADEDHGLRSWQVRIMVYEIRHSGELTRGWRRFCADNRIKAGDICTFNIIETTLWHVDITRHCKDQGTSSKELEQSDKTTFSDAKTEKEDVPSSSRKRKCKDKKPDGEENSKRPKSPTTSLNKAPSPSIVYEIGPPSWLKRKISAYILSKILYVPGNFCKAIELRRTSEITLRTTANEDHGLRSWQVRFLVYGKSNMLTRGWRGFCADNRIKEGDICTFNIIKTTLWHVDIMRHG
ncbi:hypothetical protein PAHAL_7G103900 [Panicum hallii]|uniref:TF-B3 domain-containing protein n=2 Tax=Panicum hallii TaxID=206008 RepID=A0A2S3I603_9POAL|nr:hypothetical protein PAHAL_7G103900 [Panicum hallii]